MAIPSHHKSGTWQRRRRERSDNEAGCNVAQCLRMTATVLGDKTRTVFEWANDAAAYLGLTHNFKPASRQAHSASSVREVVDKLLTSQRDHCDILSSQQPQLRWNQLQAKAMALTTDSQPPLSRSRTSSTSTSSFSFPRTTSPTKNTPTP